MQDFKCLSLAEISTERLIPKGAWERIGMTRPVSGLVWWRGYAKMKSGEFTRSLVHYEAGLGMTLCGAVVPVYHGCVTVRGDSTGGKGPCLECRKLKKEQDPCVGF